MVDDAALASRVEAAKRVLSPLDAWRAAEPERSAVETILRRVAEATPLTYVAASNKLTPVESGPAERRSRFTLPQFFAVAASIALVLSILFPTMQRKHDGRMQVACLNRMHQLGLGVAQYAAAYDGALPRVNGSQQFNWLSEPQRQHLAPMVRLHFVAPRDMFCATTGELALNDENVRRDLEAFLRRMDLRFYAIQHPAGGPAYLAAQMRMPLAGDLNPLFPQGRVASPWDDSANSPAHRGHGQNVLFTDGSAEFLRSPQLRETDNIWRAEHKVETYTGTEAPVSATDSFLIP
jgi:hypothetical protein